MYLHIIKIKINIYIFYTSDGTAMNGQSIPLSHLTELKSALNTATCTGTMAYMCTENKIPEKPFDYFFFSFLQVALSLEDHSSEVQVVKYLLHILSHPPPYPSPHHLQARHAEKHPQTPVYSSLWNTLGSVEGLPATKDGPGEF